MLKYRQTCLRLSLASKTIRKAVLPSIFGKLNIKELTLTELRNTLEILELETLQVAEHLNIAIPFTTDITWKILTMPSLDLGVSRILRHLVQAMSTLREITLQIKLPPCYHASSLYKDNNAASWSQLAQLLTSLRGIRATAHFEIVLENLKIPNNFHVGLLVDLLGVFKHSHIHNLKLKLAVGVTGFPINYDLTEDSLARLSSLSNIARTSIRNVQKPIHCALSAAMPTQTVAISSASQLDMWISKLEVPDAPLWRFQNLQLHCDGLRLGRMLCLLKLLEGSGLKQIWLALFNPNALELLRGEDLKRFFISLNSLKIVSITLTSEIAPWSALQSALEGLKSDLDEKKCELALQTCYYERIDTFRAQNGNPVPLAEPLLDSLQAVRIIVDDAITLPKYRANRVTLPAVTELHLELVADPPAANCSVESIVQWYLDGLHLPALHTLHLVIGIEPELVRPVAIHLPLLASCHCLRITNIPKHPTGEENLEEIAREFMDSLDRIRLERACDSLGIDVVYDWS